MIAALRHAGFRRLALLYTANAMLEWFGSVAIMVLVYDATDSAAVAAAMLVCKQVAPGLLIAPLSNWLDRIEPRLSLGASFGVHAAGLAILAASGYGYWLFPIAILAGTASATARGVIRAEVARTLPGGALRSGNALLNLVLGVIMPVGPVVAAVVIASSGPASALALSAAMLGVLASVSLLGFRSAIDADEPRLEVEADSTSASAGNRVLPIGALIALAAAATGIASVDEPSLLAFTRDSLGAGVGGYGAIFAAQAIGLTVGGFLFSRLLAWSMIRIYAFGTALVGIGLMGMGLSPNIEVACVFAAVAGAGAGMDWVALVTAAQEATPEGQEGRVTARLEAAGMAGPGVGLLLGGLIAELGTPRLALLVPGIAAIAVLGLVAAYMARRSATSAVPMVPAVSLPTTIPGGSR